MGEILLLEEHYHQLSQSLEECTLFGRRDYVQMGTNFYDLYYHYVPGDWSLRVDAICESIVVLPHIWPEEENGALLDMQKRCTGRDSQIYAMRSRDSPSLRFYCADDVSATLLDSADIWIVSEKDFARAIPSWSEYKERIVQAKKYINNHLGYHTA